MNKKYLTTVIRYGIFLSVVTLSLFVFGLENGYSGQTSTETNDVYSEEDGTSFTVSDAQQTRQQEVDPKEKKNDEKNSHMMGHGHVGPGWVWAGIMVILMVLMMA